MSFFKAFHPTRQCTLGTHRARCSLPTELRFFVTYHFVSANLLFTFSSSEFRGQSLTLQRKEKKQDELGSPLLARFYIVSRIPRRNKRFKSLVQSNADSSSSRGVLGRSLRFCKAEYMSLVALPGVGPYPVLRLLVKAYSSSTRPILLELAADFGLTICSVEMNVSIRLV